MKKLLSSLTLILLSLFFAFSVSAEQINDFKAKININRDGTILIEENIVYDFGNLSKHGIYRDIPYLKTNNQGKKFRLDYSIQSVNDKFGNSYRYTTSHSGNNLKIKIGDPNKTITGIHTYTITYKVSGALTYYSDHDELYWNITGTEWIVPIYRAQAEIIFPRSLNQSDVKMDCFTGAYKSTTKDCSFSFQNNTATFNGIISLASGQGLTLVFGFPKNLIAVLEPKEQVDFFNTILGKIITTGLVLIGLFWFIFYPLWLPIKWWLYGRDPKAVSGPVRAWYEPPKTKNSRSLTPAETGTIIDESADMRDIMATVVDLARRGYFKIVEKKKNDFYFIKQKDFSDDLILLNFEKKLLEESFKTKEEVRLKDKQLYSTVEEMKKMIYEDMVKDGLFPGNPQKTRTFYNAMAGLALFTCNFLLVLTALIFGRAMSKRTTFGAEQKNVAKSLFNFLNSQERQLKFQAEKQMFFEKLLPYAVAFGVEKVWANRFKDVGIAQPEWYQGYDQRTFSTIYFANSLGSSLSSFKSSATPTTSSSGFHSGFSGGGFSGGGGGGGGGGSW